MKPMQPSADLAAVVGPRPISRPEVTKRIWEYIRKNGLQDGKNRRQINADDRLRRVFGGRRQVSMFDMPKLLNAHLANT
jgi:chromatin remodeling complex protein RSC6